MAPNNHYYIVIIVSMENNCSDNCALLIQCMLKYFLQKPKRTKRPRRRRAGNCQKRRYNELINWYTHWPSLSFSLSFITLHDVHDVHDAYADSGISTLKKKAENKSVRKKKKEKSAREQLIEKKKDILLPRASSLCFCTYNIIRVNRIHEHELIVHACKRRMYRQTMTGDVCGRVREIATFSVNVQIS